MNVDLKIAQEAILEPIGSIAAKLGIDEDALIPYGKNKAKIEWGTVRRLKQAPKAHLVLVTAISPTPAGEGKTTTSIGLCDGMRSLGVNAALALREPSLGPVFGVKGGAAGGGYAQVVPMEELNLHFTGDIHAVTSAHNLLCAMLDNHIFQGNELKIDLDNITIKRVLDMNDRQLRVIRSGFGGGNKGVERNDGFDITAASEVMAVLCLAQDLTDLKRRLGNIVVAYDTDGKAVTAAMLKAQGAMAALLKDALLPNLVQTLEGAPAFVHGGPFANIAHGCNTVIATKTAMGCADWVVTEAGFGADLGAEKFLDIKCRMSGIWPEAVVLVATIRALKYHGGVAKEDLNEPNVEAVKKGMCNLTHHIHNIKSLGLPVVVAINAFVSDTEEEQQCVADACAREGVPVERCTAWAQGGKGARALAKTVMETARKTVPQYVYDTGLSIQEKIELVVKNWYGGAGVEYTPKALRGIENLVQNGYEHLPVCIAKTQFSFSDKPALLGDPKGFTVKVKQVRLQAGSEFIVARAGTIMTMPGLPPVPAAQGVDVDADGNISGLF